MDEKKLALIGLDGAIREVIFLLDFFLNQYDSIKFIKDAFQQEDKLREISYTFNAFVRSAKSALDLMSNLSDEKKSDFMNNFCTQDGFDYLMKLARDAITHGGRELTSGTVTLQIEGTCTLGLVCAPIYRDKKWHTPPKQDAASLAIDYLLAILRKAEHYYGEAKKLTGNDWEGIKEWELEGLKATVHLLEDWDKYKEDLEHAMPDNVPPCLKNTNWVSEAIRQYDDKRQTIYPTFHLERGRGDYTFPRAATP